MLYFVQVDQLRNFVNALQFIQGRPQEHAMDSLSSRATLSFRNSISIQFDGRFPLPIDVNTAL